MTTTEPSRMKAPSDETLERLYSAEQAVLDALHLIPEQDVKAWLISSEASSEARAAYEALGRAELERRRLELGFRETETV